MVNIIKELILDILTLGLRRYAVSRKYENTMLNTMEEIKSDSHELRLSITQLKILNLIQHDPKDKYTICLLYDEYKKNGGNSYLDAMYNKWSKKYNK